MSQKLLIITGASQGIGEKTAERFLKEDYAVINLSRKPLNLKGIENLKLDLIHEDESLIHNRLLTRISEKQNITLVHNASVCYNDSIETFSAEHWQETFKLNVSIPALLTQWLLPYMLAPSAIIFVGSTLSEKAVPNTASYTASKHAVIGLMRSVCQDLAGRGIHTACVCPGITDTAMLHQRVDHNLKTLEYLAQIQSHGRLIEPSEIAEAIFVSATHPIFNGAVLHANAGQIER